jgi:RimJ/RimL family protein N-acetyltransferase
VLVRAARVQDDAALQPIDAVTWTSEVSPAPGDGTLKPVLSADDVPHALVAELDGRVVGYVRVRPSSLSSSAHVHRIDGLAVDPAVQGHGAGTALVEAAVTLARSRGARKVTLAVLAHNTGARRVYERCGFVEEGVLRQEYLLDGRWVDDVLLARHLA